MQITRTNREAVMKKKGKRFKIKECPPDHPIYTRNKIYLSPVSKTHPIGTFTLDLDKLNTGTSKGRATLELIRMWDGPDSLDPIGEYMVMTEMPLTRETYLSLAYPDGFPENWGADDEAKLPEMFRELDQYGDGEY